MQMKSLSDLVLFFLEYVYTILTLFRVKVDVNHYTQRNMNKRLIYGEMSVNTLWFLKLDYKHVNKFKLVFTSLSDVALDGVKALVYFVYFLIVIICDFTILIDKTATQLVLFEILLTIYLLFYCKFGGFFINIILGLCVYPIVTNFYFLFRFLIVNFFITSYKNKEFFKTFYTVLSLYFSTFDFKLSVILFSAFMLLSLTLIESEFFVPPRFFKLFLIDLLRRSEVGRVSIKEISISKYKYFLICNPCFTPICKKSFNEFGILEKDERSKSTCFGGDENKYNGVDYSGRYKYKIGESSVKINCYKGLDLFEEEYIDNKSDYTVVLVIKGVLNESLHVSGSSRSVENLLTALKWYSENPECGIHINFMDEHCLNFKEIINLIFYNNYIFKKVKAKRCVMNLGISLDFLKNYMGTVLNYRGNVIKALISHNKKFLKEPNYEVLFDLLENKAALGGSGLGSSVYKRYCSDVNNIIEALTGRKHFIKLVKDKKISDDLKDFLKNDLMILDENYEKIGKKVKVKVLYTLKDNKKDLLARLKPGNIFKGKSPKSEFKVIGGPNTNQSEENVVTFKNKETFVEVLKKFVEDKVLKVITEPSYVMNEIPVLKKTKREINEIVKIEPLEAYQLNRRNLRSRDIDKIDNFLANNSVDTEENSEKLRSMLYRTRCFKSGLVKTVTKTVYNDNQVIINKLIEENEKIKEKMKNVEHKEAILDKMKDINDCFGYIFREVERNKKSRGGQQNQVKGFEIDLKNRYDPLSGVEDEESPEKSTFGRIFENSVNENGLVNQVKNMVGKKALKVIFKKVRTEIRRGNKVGNNNAETSLEKKIKGILSESIKRSNRKLSLKYLNGESILNNQIVRRLKKWKMHLKASNFLDLNELEKQKNVNEEIIVNDFKELKELVCFLEKIVEKGYFVFFKEQMENLKTYCKRLKFNI